MTTDLEGAVERLKRRAYELDQRLGGFPEAYAAATAMYEAADALASITRERDAMREAGKPFFDLAKTVTTPASGSPPWWQESQDWTVVFSFAGCAVTLGDLRRAAALVNGEVG